MIYFMIAVLVFDLVYVFFRLLIMMKLKAKSWDNLFALCWHQNNLDFWSVDSTETWRLFTKTTRFYRSKHYIDGQRVDRLLWWCYFLRDTAVVR